MSPSWAQAEVSRMRSRSAESIYSWGTLLKCWRTPRGSMNWRLGGTSKGLAVMTSFPSRSRTWYMPSSLPTASQSGRWWVVRRIFFLLPMSSTNWGQSTSMGAGSDWVTRISWEWLSCSFALHERSGRDVSLRWPGDASRKGGGYRTVLACASGWCVIGVCLPLGFADDLACVLHVAMHLG